MIKRFVKQLISEVKHLNMCAIKLKGKNLTDGMTDVR